MPKIRRALLTVSDKSSLIELGQALARSGAELVATGKTAQVLEQAGLKVVPIERISGSPEAFQGRMKTLSFPVCSGILYRRGDSSDEADLRKLGIQPIDCVVVNFYPFEAAAARTGIAPHELIEEIDVGGPTLVRAAAKNAPQTVVLTHPSQYERVITELEKTGEVSDLTSQQLSAEAWDRVSDYDVAISEKLGARQGEIRIQTLRYGENPHQDARLEYDASSPIAWDQPLTPHELSYNNILDLSSAYALAGDLLSLAAQVTGVVIVKHNNPCGIALVPKSVPGAQLAALELAWQGDPVSAFGGVIVFTDPIEDDTATFLSERFIEVIAAPGLQTSGSGMQKLLSKRKNLKGVPIRKFFGVPKENSVHVPGGRLIQTVDYGLNETFQVVTQAQPPKGKDGLVRFGIAAVRSLKSNALAIVREVPGMAGAYQLVGAGQGQPNRVDALERLAIPRARAVLETIGGSLEECLLVSDAFFPFRDTVDGAAKAGIRWIVQPGGSIKDAESITAANEHKIAMVFTGIRHFKH